MENSTLLSRTASIDFPTFIASYLRCWIMENPNQLSHKRKSSGSQNSSSKMKRKSHNTDQTHVATCKSEPDQNGESDGSSTSQIISKKLKTESVVKAANSAIDESSFDHSDQSISSALNNVALNNVSSFPQRLRTVLDDANNESIIRWHLSGLSFKVHDKESFESIILPKYFMKKSKYWSFTRKLGRWGFSRISSGVDIGSYHHPLFQRDQLNLMDQMICHNATGKVKTNERISSARSPSTNQDTYSTTNERQTHISGVEELQMRRNLRPDGVDPLHSWTQENTTSAHFQPRLPNDVRGSTSPSALSTNVPTWRQDMEARRIREALLHQFRQQEEDNAVRLLLNNPLPFSYHTHIETNQSLLHNAVESNLRSFSHIQPSHVTSTNNLFAFPPSPRLEMPLAGVNDRLLLQSLGSSNQSLLTSMYPNLAAEQSSLHNWFVQQQSQRIVERMRAQFTMHVLNLQGITEQKEQETKDDSAFTDGETKHSS